jgi:putative MATE family efflux protein
MSPDVHQRPLWRRFLVFLGPLVLTNVLQALGGTATTIYLGKLLGTRALAAAVSFFPLFMCCISFVIGLGAGASVLIGQAWGARDEEKVRRVAGTVLVGTLVLSLIVGVPGFIFIGHVLRALGTPPDVLPESVAYARVLLASMPVLFLHLMSASLLRGLGDSVTPLKVLLVASGVWMLLTPAFILGWGGLPRLGTTSAAWASLTGNTVAVAWIVWHLHRRQHLLSLARLRPYFAWNAPLLRTVVRLGVPTGLFFLTGSAADALLLSLVNAHGSQATAAWGSVGQVMVFVQFPAMSIAIAASVFAAQAIGAGKTDEVAHVTRVGLQMNLVLTGGLALIVALCAPLAASLFTRDAVVIDLAASVLRITVWGSLAFGMASVFTGVMRSAGTVRVPTMLSLGCLAGVLFPLAWVLQQMIGVKGVWMAYPITYGIGLLLQGTYFYGVWKRAPIRKLV